MFNAILVSLETKVNDPHNLSWHGPPAQLDLSFTRTKLQLEILKNLDYFKKIFMSSTSTRTFPLENKSNAEEEKDDYVHKIMNKSKRHGLNLSRS
jgi:hypothetical protein